MIKQKIQENKGITLLVLAIIIIVLLILAGVTIATITGDNGILRQAGDAKLQAEIANEKEIVEECVVKTEGRSRYGDIEKTILEKCLNNAVGENKTKVYNDGLAFIVKFCETNRVYRVKENGEVEIESPDILVADKEGGKLDGSGSETDPFVIMSIEDLVYFSSQVCNGNNFENSYIMLGKDLNFQSELSYCDLEQKYRYDQETTSYIKDDNASTTLMELCISGEGFIPIGNTTHSFAGNFNGKGHTLRNLYEDRSGYAGLFGQIKGGWLIKNIAVTDINIYGNITSKDDYAGGIAADISVNTKEIKNCNIYVNVTGKNAGGIAGYERYAKSDFSIENCNIYNEINAAKYAGGLVGFFYDSLNAKNCNNYAQIEGNTSGGLIGHQESGEVKINKCKNKGTITGTSNAGGMVGSIYIGKTYIYNCFNDKDSRIYGKDCAGGIYGSHGNYGRMFIYNSYVLGKIAGEKYLGGICAGAYSRERDSYLALTIENTFFGGTIEGGTTKGGIVGVNKCDSLEKMSFSNCYFINSAAEKGISNAEKEGITALSEQNMKENETLYTNLKNYTNTEYELLEWTKKEHEYPSFVE